MGYKYLRGIHHRDILNVDVCAEKVNDSNDWISNPFAGQVAFNCFAPNSSKAKLRQVLTDH